MAEVLYNTYTETEDAESAGVEVSTPGITLGERQKLVGKSNTVELMQKKGYDISDNIQTQLTEDMLTKYHKVISMCDESIAPGWLLNAPNYCYWDIKDPVGADMPFFEQTYQKVKAHVLELIKS